MSTKNSLQQFWKIAWSICVGFIAAQIVMFFLLVLFFRLGFNRPDKDLSPYVDWGCTAIVALTVPVVAVLQYRRQTAEDSKAEVKRNEEKFNRW